MAATLLPDTGHHHGVPNHTKQKCTSATCCSPSRLWRSVQLFIGSHNQSDLAQLCRDPNRGSHVLRVLVTSRLSNDPALYPASHKHRVIPLPKGAETVLGKSGTDLNALQLALFHGDETIAVYLLQLIRQHVSEKDQKQFVNHLWGKANGSLHLAGFLNMSRVVQLLLEMGARPDCVNGNGKTPLDCSALDCRTLIQNALPIKTPVTLPAVVPKRLDSSFYGTVTTCYVDVPPSKESVFPMVRPMALVFDQEEEDDDEEDDDEDDGGYYDDDDGVPELVDQDGRCAPRMDSEWDASHDDKEFEISVDLAIGAESPGGSLDMNISRDDQGGTDSSGDSDGSFVNYSSSGMDSSGDGDGSFCNSSSSGMDSSGCGGGGSSSMAMGLLLPDQEDGDDLATCSSSSGGDDGDDPWKQQERQHDHDRKRHRRRQPDSVPATLDDPGYHHQTDTSWLFPGGGYRYLLHEFSLFGIVGAEHLEGGTRLHDAWRHRWPSSHWLGKKDEGPGKRLQLMNHCTNQSLACTTPILSLAPAHYLSLAVGDP